MAYVIHANLDAEARWAHRTLPAAVAVRASYYATLTSALAPDDATAIEVWTPAPVDASRLVADPAWRIPTLHVGTPARADLVWAPAASQRANDRRVALALAEELGVALPGARAVTTDEELVAATEGLVQWVAKAPFTTAGRDRAHDLPAARKLLAHVRALVVEPWCERLFDVGVCGEVTGSSVVLHAPHTLHVTHRGGFAGISLDPPPLTDDERATVMRTAQAAGERILALGHTGPFAIDAFVYDRAGTRALHPLCEINARHTFGTITHALARRGARHLWFAEAPPDSRIIISAEPRIAAWIK